jgi:hypothetical protein
LTYSQFNQQILQYYRDQAGSSFCHLGISLADFQQIISIEEVTQFAELRNPWSYLLNRQTEEPQYFGLLAVQCLATALMENDGQFTSNAYQIRLMRLVGLANEQSLQLHFKEYINGLAVQEQLWESARAYVELEMGKQLSIPSKSSFRGRFVQYPLSQALLRKQDLKTFLPLFRKYLKVNENISLTDFVARVFGQLDQVQLAGRAAKVLTAPLTKDAAVRQVFHYFLLWDGSDEAIAAGAKIPSGQAVRSVLVLRVQQGVPCFFLYPDMQAVAHEAIWSTPGFNDHHPNLRIFNVHEYYRDEFEEARLLVPRTSAWVLFDSSKWPNLYQYFINHQKPMIALDGRCLLFYLDESDEAVAELRNFFASQSPVRFTGGLKTGRGRVYFEGFGPSIDCEHTYTVLHNGKKCAYDPASVAMGVYSVRSAYFRDAEFRIIPAAPINEPICTRKRGWDLKTMSVSGTAGMEGALWYDTHKEDPMNSWLQLHSGSRLARKVSYRNPLLQALANYYEQEQ